MKVKHEYLEPAILPLGLPVGFICTSSFDENVPNEQFGNGDNFEDFNW